MDVARALAKVIIPRAFRASAVLGGLVYLFGGDIDGTTASDVHGATIDPGGGIDTPMMQQVSMPAPRKSAPEIVLGNFVYLFGGADDLGRWSDEMHLLLDEN